MTSLGQVWRLVGIVTLLFAVGIASAQPVRPPPGERQGERFGPQRMMHEPRKAASEDEGAMQRRQRMTPEERRQLRRDVHDAGRDIYPERMRERRRDMRRGE